MCTFQELKKLIFFFFFKFLKKCSRNTFGQCLFFHVTIFCLLVTFFDKVPVIFKNCPFENKAQKCPWQTLNWSWQLFLNLTVKIPNYPWSFKKKWAWYFWTCPWQFPRICPWKIKRARNKISKEVCHGHFWLSWKKKTFVRKLCWNNNPKTFRL